MDTRLYARWYARRGILVFPCHTIEDGRCTCGKACHSPGKHPIGTLVPHGVHDATADIGMIDQWWAMYPDANVGIATGRASGIVVIDIDPDHGGEDSWANLEARFGATDDTWWVETGSGGYHIYFAAGEAETRNSAGMVGPGIDVRGDGGYVIAPPSLHVSGGQYRWSDHLNHKTIDQPAPMPEWLDTRVHHGRRGGGNHNANPLPEKISEGARNAWMASIAGTMRRRGMSRQAVEAALKVENKLRCAPPLEEREIERIAASIDRYPAAVGGVRLAS